MNPSLYWPSATHNTSRRSSLAGVYSLRPWVYKLGEPVEEFTSFRRKKAINSPAGEKLTWQVH